MKTQFVAIFPWPLFLQMGCLSTVDLEIDDGIEDAPSCRDANGDTRPINHPKPGDIQFTEVMASPGATLDQYGEWIELRVTSAGDSIDLNDIELVRGDPTEQDNASVLWSTPPSSEIPDCAEFSKGDYIVLSGSNDQGGIDFDETFDFQLLNDEPESLYLRTAADVIAEVDYVESPGASWSLDDTGEWCFSSKSFVPDEVPGESDLGTPGELNPLCGKCRDTDGLRTIVHPSSSNQVVITEFMAQPSSSEFDEWIEIHNLGDSFDLNGLTLGKTKGQETVASESCIEVDQGAYVVLAMAPDIQGISPAYVMDRVMRLANDDGEFWILDKENNPLDSIFWDSTSAGSSTSLGVDPHSDPPDHADDDWPGWCYTNGTPGTVNEACSD